MDKVLKYDSVLAVRGNNRGQTKQEMYTFLLNNTRYYDGSPIVDCISKWRIDKRALTSDGLLITVNNNVIDFQPYYKNQAIAANNQYAIPNDVLEEIFNNKHKNKDDNNIKALIITVCENDVIVIEFSKDKCNDDGVGGDGLKVKVPTGT